MAITHVALTLPNARPEKRPPQGLKLAYFKTHIGQFIDSTLCKNKEYLSLTREKYIMTSQYKTSFYTFQFPILCGLALTGNYSDNAYKLVESIGSDVGLLFQMKLSEYHTHARDTIQGKLTFLAFDALAEQKDLTEEKLHQVQVLAWAVELVQSYFIIGDDMEDNCQTRCGKPTWHSLPNVGLLAINDASMLRSFIYEMLKNNFDQNTSTKMENCINEAFFTINIGQYMDIMMSKSRDLDKFTVEQYNFLNDYKSSFYTVKLPILLALELCNKSSEDSYSNVDKIGMDLGILLQMQNDVMDYIDRDSASVKTSSDIQKNKCSWPAVTALKHLNGNQRKEFINCYGRWESEKVERVRQFYKEINLPHLYHLEEQKMSQAVLQKIKELPVDATPSANFFYKIFDFVRQYTEDISPSKIKSTVVMNAA
ncbi:PREDICTED: farnesyl pyrophosphate synthase-like [Papilio polytes]|uniref:farnesyl pyrophosphate synthase-like n=1 Tax=Papilio polytes TaxID=76194 RepID=UPI000675D42E|nr:PREDICTED: farnesyl pyrophosphate synthase-like [Papilio polytes]